MSNEDKNLTMYLDIDGVICPYAMGFIYREPAEAGTNKDDDGYHNFCPECIEVLNKLYDEFKFEIVISSSWRKMFDHPSEMDALFKQRGIKPDVVAMTRNGGHNRDLQILHHITTELTDADYYIALDDEWEYNKHIRSEYYFRVRDRARGIADVYDELREKLLKILSVSKGT